MGTSKPWPGPTGQPWTGLGRRRSTSANHPNPEEQYADVAEKLIAALQDVMRAEPEAFGLRDATSAAGRRLVTTLEALGQNQLVDADSLTAEQRDAFVARVVDEVGGSGRLVTDAVLRRAVRTTAERLLGERGDRPAGAGLNSDVFCWIYRWFFGDVVSEFVKLIIAEKIKLAVPVLPIFDPVGLIPDKIAEWIVKLIPNPCERSIASDKEATSLAGRARGLLAESVDRALGIGAPETEAA